MWKEFTDLRERAARSAIHSEGKVHLSLFFKEEGGGALHPGVSYSKGGYQFVQ
jgi:hypothetical protein